MASLNSLPSELVARIVSLATLPIIFTSTEWGARRDELLRLSLVRPLRQAAQRELLRAVRLDEDKAASVLVMVRDRDVGALVEGMRIESEDVLPALDDLTISNSVLGVVSADVSFPRLTKLSLFYVVAEQVANRNLFSPACLPRLRHLLLEYDADRLPEVGWPYTQPDAAFVSRLVSIEHNDASRLVQYGATRNGTHNSVWAADIFPLITGTGAGYGVHDDKPVHHLRIRLREPYELPDRAAVPQLALRMLPILRTNPHLMGMRQGTLRTVLLPLGIQSRPDLLASLVVDSAEQAPPANVVFEDEPGFAMFARPSTYVMELAEAQSSIET